MVRTSGCRYVVPTACAVISFFTTAAPSMAPTRRRALPVVPTARTRMVAWSICAPRSATTRRAASVGLPSVHRYDRATMARSASTMTPFVEMDPMSIPRKHSARPGETSGMPDAAVPSGAEPCRSKPSSRAETRFVCFSRQSSAPEGTSPTSVVRPVSSCSVISSSPSSWPACRRTPRAGCPARCRWSASRSSGTGWAGPCRG